MARPTNISNVRIAKEGPMPGYTGHVPGVKGHVIGHSYSDASKRGVAITETLRHKELARSIHLSTENRCAKAEQDFHAELSRPREHTDPKAQLWRCSKKEAPRETRWASGKVQLDTLRQCIGTTDGPARPNVPLHMALGDLPYKSTTLMLKKEWNLRGPEYHIVNQGEHHMKGYTGHVHAEQHIFGKTYGQTTRELRPAPAEPSTSAAYIHYADNRPLVVNEFELKHPMKFQHNILLREGEGTLGPVPRIPSTWKPPLHNDSSQFKSTQDYYAENP